MKLDVNKYNLRKFFPPDIFATLTGANNNLFAKIRLFTAFFIISVVVNMTKNVCDATA